MKRAMELSVDEHEQAGQMKYFVRAGQRSAALGIHFEKMIRVSR